MIYEELSGNILKAYFNALKNLGTGYLESVYENAMSVELDELNIPYERQKHLTVIYKGHNIGEFAADIVVENKLINYLTITQHKVGLLLNFGEGRDYKRVYLKDM